jgi:hypothetical protein
MNKFYFFVAAANVGFAFKIKKAIEAFLSLLKSFN